MRWTWASGSSGIAKVDEFVAKAASDAGGTKSVVTSYIKRGTLEGDAIMEDIMEAVFGMSVDDLPQKVI